ncbi:MAG: hypothetical protein EGQ35_06380 [Clostridiales bacterium]|nr:hypothetical protein [Clostridiales bacterium]
MEIHFKGECQKTPLYFFALIVIDKFHVVRYITWTLENVRKRI